MGCFADFQPASNTQGPIDHLTCCGFHSQPAAHAVHVSLPWDINVFSTHVETCCRECHGNSIYGPLTITEWQTWNVIFAMCSVRFFYRLKVVLLCFIPGSIPFDAFAQLGTVAHVHTRAHTHTLIQKQLSNDPRLFEFWVFRGVCCFNPTQLWILKGLVEGRDMFWPGSCGWRFLHRWMPSSLLHVSGGSPQEARRKPAEASGAKQFQGAQLHRQGQRSTGTSKFHGVSERGQFATAMTSCSASNLSVRLWQSTWRRPPEPTRADCQTW